MSASFSDTAIGVTVFFVLKKKKKISPNQILYSNLALVWKVLKNKKVYLFLHVSKKHSAKFWAEIRRNYFFLCRVILILLHLAAFLFFWEPKRYHLFVCPSLWPSYLEMLKHKEGFHLILAVCSISFKRHWHNTLLAQKDWIC